MFWWDRNKRTQGKVDEATLPINAELRRQLDDWYAIYSELYLQAHGGPVTESEKRLLDDKGVEVWQRMRAELDGVYQVLFFSEQFSRPFETPEEFDAERRKPYF